MKHYSLIFLILLTFFFTMFSCKENARTFTMIVASEQRACQGEGVQKCYLVKYSNTEEWTYFYDEIVGFKYIEGYEYVIEVRVHEIENPPMDASLYTYTFVKEISKKQMRSKDLPD